MGFRVVAFLLAVFLFHGVWRFVAASVALVVPYFAVVYANGGREPDSTARFESFQPRLPSAYSAPSEQGDSLTRGGSWVIAGAEEPQASHDDPGENGAGRRGAAGAAGAGGADAPNATAAGTDSPHGRDASRDRPSEPSEPS
jgi:Protein of unknown function (DUF3099)